MTGLTLSIWLLLAFCIVIEAARELCFKKAANDAGMIETLKKPLIWFGILLWAIELLAWTNVLENVPLTIAFPIMSLVYVIVLFGSSWLFDEYLNKRHILGALLITAGASIVGANI